MWKNNVGLSRPQMKILRMRIACWITKATHTLTICNIYCFSTGTNGCKNTPSCYVTRKFLVSFGFAQSFFLSIRLWPLLPTHCRCRGLLLYHMTDIHTPGRIRTRSPRRREATDLQFRPRGHWDRPFLVSAGKRKAAMFDIGNWGVLKSYVSRSMSCMDEGLWRK
jgi:hypothetical protein